MNRAIATMIGMMAMGMVGCMGASPDDLGAGEDSLRAARARFCLSSDNCERGEYCTVEDGDCFSNCRPGRVCPAVCWGVCRADEREDCGAVTCGEGTTCCNPSCGVCTGPDEYCTQQICDSVSLER